MVSQGNDTWACKRGLMSHLPDRYSNIWISLLVVFKGYLDFRCDGMLLPMYLCVRVEGRGKNEEQIL